MLSMEEIIEKMRSEAERLGLGKCDHWLGIKETAVLKQIEFDYCPKCGEKLCYTL